MNLNLTLKKISKPFWSMSEQLCTPIVYFVLTPFLISINEATYGHWGVLVTIATFAQVINLSITAVTPRTVSTLSGKNIYTYMSRTLQIILVMGSLSILICTISLFITEDTGLVYLLFASAAIITSQDLDNLYSNTLKGLQHFRESSVIELITRILWGLFIYIGVNYGNDIILITVMAYVFKMLVKIFIINCFLIARLKVEQEFKVYPFHDLKNKLLEIKNSKWMWVQMIGGLAIGAGDRFLVTSQFSTEALVNYLPLIQLSRIVFTIASSGSQVLLPYIANKVSTNNFNVTDVTKILFITSLLSAIPSICLIIVNHHILEIWLGSDYANLNSTTLIYLTTASLFLAMLSPLHFVLLGLQFDRFLAIVNIVAGGFYFLMAFYLIRFGIESLAFAKIIYPLIQSVYIIKYIQIIIHKNKAITKIEY